MSLDFLGALIRPIRRGLGGGVPPGSADQTGKFPPPARLGGGRVRPPHLLLSAPAGVVTPASDFLHRASWSSCDSIERSASVETKAYQLLVCSRESSNRKLH